MLLMEIGQKLALAREYHRPALTQEAFAPMLGVRRGTLARWETQNSAPSQVIAKAATLLQIPVSWFYEKEDTPPPLAASDARTNNGETNKPNLDDANAKPVDSGGAGLGPKALLQAREVLLPVWRGVLAGEDGECVFEPNETEFRSLPAFVVTGDPQDYRDCIASGQSMSPRLEQGEEAVIKLNPNPPLNTLVVATSPEGSKYIKALKKGADGNLELHPLNPQYKPICRLEGWTLDGGVVAIFHAYDPGKPNIEWDGGRLLKA